MKYFTIFVVVLIILSLALGLFVTYDKKYITEDIFVFEYTNLNVVGNRIIRKSVGAFSWISGLVSGLHSVFSIFSPKEIELPNISELSIEDECGVYQVKEKNGEYSYIVFIRCPDISYGVVIFNNSSLFAECQFGDLISLTGPALDEFWLFNQVANFYLVDGFGEPLVDDDGNKLSLSRYYSVFSRRGPDNFTIREFEEKFDITVI